jgi:hypothetical protein
LIKPDGTPLERLFSGHLTTDTHGLASTTLTVSKAYPETTLKIYGNYSGYSYANPVRDDFAIRPDHFILQMPPVNKAGEQITMHLQAVDKHDDPATAYNETIYDSFKVGYQEQKSGCDTTICHFSTGRIGDC